MAIINPTLPTPGDPRGSEETDVRNAVVALLNLVNGNIDAANVLDASLTAEELAAALAVQLGVTSGGAVRRGKSIIAGEHTRTNVAFGTLGATPGTDSDQVSAVVVPNGGLLRIRYLAALRGNTDPSTITAALFIGASQLREPSTDLDTGSVVQVSTTVGGAGIPANQYTAVDMGRSSVLGVGDAAFAALPTTGLKVTPIDVLVAAGTYDISVQFKSSAGSVSAKDRRLLVETIGF